MGEVVQLPTAAPQRVRVTRYYRLGVKVRRELNAAGKVVHHPAQFRSPADRRTLEEAEKRADMLREGGITRSGPTMLAGALFMAMDPDRQQAALDRLQLLNSAFGDPSTEAALAYARSLFEAAQ